MRKIRLIMLLMLGFGIAFDSQAFLFFKKKKKEVVVAKKTDDADSKSKKPKEYGQVITKKAKTSKGLFTVHKVDNNYFFEIPDSLLNRDFLVVNRIAKSAAENRRGFIGYAGDQIGDNVIRFEKGPNDKIFIKTISFSERAADTLGMYRSVLNSNLQPIVASFDVKAYKNDSIRKTHNSVIDVTDFVNGDNPVLFFDERFKRFMSIGNQYSDRSYIDTIKSFPVNIEIRTVKTYAPKPQNPSDIATDPLTYELNSSIVLLPKNPMTPRYFDPRVGYFATGYIDFDTNPQGIEQIKMITRWRLEPKPEDVEKYKRGELVEPQKPIVFYIDPATPKKWVKYLIQGVNDWQVAFEQAGFKNAIYALEAPKDSTWSIDDASHSAIVYKPSDIPNASGPHVHDPRTGEILETHINWYHNVMKLLHDWYFIQTAAVDTAARKMQFSDELMGQLIRFVSSHEVGHTLGLRHNWGSSATVPVDSLRNKKWVEANGHTPSIMDYARFNYVAQPEDNVTYPGLFPRIGMYDKWAIDWGYRWFPQYKTAKDETPELNKWIMSQLNKDKRYQFGTETDPSDPRNQNEDLGDDAMKASAYGIKNLQRILPNIMTWTKEPDKDYSDAKDMYDQLIIQFGRYMGHVAKNIGGKYTTPKSVEQTGNVFEDVPAAKQKEALEFLNKQLFTTPSWLIDKNLVGIAGASPVGSIEKVDVMVMNRIINIRTLETLLENEAYNGASAYTASQLFDDLKKSVWSELSSGKAIDIYRRGLQRAYVQSLVALVALSANPAVISDAPAVARGQLIALRTDIAKAIPAAKGISKSHLQDMYAIIDTALNTKK